MISFIHLVLLPVGLSLTFSFVFSPWPIESENNCGSKSLNSLNANSRFGFPTLAPGFLSR